MTTLIRSSIRVSNGHFSRNIVNMTAARAKHTLPDLPYPYDALEPSISKEIMTLHHTKHHQTYVNGLNAAEESLSKFQSSDDVKGQLGLQAALKFNGGGHIHWLKRCFSQRMKRGLMEQLFWKNLAPTSSSASKPDAAPKFIKQVEKDFGSLDNLKTEMNAKTAAIQGSGWGWLGYDKKKGQLEIVTTANQDPLLSHTPIIGIDIWEHAFYLQYKNVKPDAIWDVINFEEAEKRFTSA